MVYYKIPLTGGLDYPAGCILCCAYTYEGYEYCKFERVTSVGSGWIEITESEFEVLCPDFPTPSESKPTKHITQIGEKNGMKYTIYSDGTVECWGIVFVTADGTDGTWYHCDLASYLPSQIKEIDSAQVTALNVPWDATEDEHFALSVYSVNIRMRGGLGVQFGYFENGIGNYKKLNKRVENVGLSVHVWGTTEA